VSVCASCGSEVGAADRFCAGRRHGEMDSLAQAREIYDELGAKRWLERLAEASEVAA